MASLPSLPAGLTNERLSITESLFRCCDPAAILNPLRVRISAISIGTAGITAVSARRLFRLTRSGRFFLRKMPHCGIASFAPRWGVAIAEAADRSSNLNKHNAAECECKLKSCQENRPPDNPPDNRKNRGPYFPHPVLYCFPDLQYAVPASRRLPEV